MARTAIIVQARMGSSRLPGKILLELGGTTVLAQVLRRCRAVRNADIVCCAVADDPNSDAVAAEAARCGVEVVRGSEGDVLSRYHLAARRLGAEVVLRVTSDCPLVDPAVCAQVVSLRDRENADFACNNAPAGWPHGLDCECFTFEWLDRAQRESRAPFEREHVSPYMRNHPDIRLVNLDGPGGASVDHRWTLDFPEDLAFFRTLFAELPADCTIPTTAEVLALIDRKPWIAAINRMHHRGPAQSAAAAKG